MRQLGSPYPLYSSSALDRFCGSASSSVPTPQAIEPDTPHRPRVYSAVWLIGKILGRNSTNPWRSSVLASVTTTAIINPSISTKIYRFRPLIRLLPSKPMSSCWVAVLRLCESMLPTKGSGCRPSQRRSKRCSDSIKPVQMPWRHQPLDIIVDGVPVATGWENQAPLAAGLVEPENAVDDLSQINLLRDVRAY